MTHTSRLVCGCALAGFVTNCSLLASWPEIRENTAAAHAGAAGKPPTNFAGNSQLSQFVVGNAGVLASQGAVVNAPVGASPAGESNTGPVAPTGTTGEVGKAGAVNVVPVSSYSAGGGVSDTAGGQGVTALAGSSAATGLAIGGAAVSTMGTGGRSVPVGGQGAISGRGNSVAGAKNPTVGGRSGTVQDNLRGGSSGAGGTSLATSTASGGTPSASGSPGSGGAVPVGGSAVVSSAAGSMAYVCPNTDKTTLPVDVSGWVDRTCNNYGIQGRFYWYADSNTKVNLKCGGNTCVDKKPPWQSGSPGPGMCISGKTTGSSNDWGAGIGLGLNTAIADVETKLGYNATANGVAGFDITLSGNTNGMDIRVGIGTSANGMTISPFIPVPALSGTPLQLSGISQIKITNATIPADWGSTDPSPPDPTQIYDLQVQVVADTAPVGTPFELCVTAVTPTGEASTPAGPMCNASDGGTVTGTEVKPLGSYGFQANTSAATSGSQTVHGYSGIGCAAIAVAVSGNLKGNGDAPAAYPSIINGWQWGHGFTGSYNQGSVKTIFNLASVTSTMSFTPPSGNKWDVAYDIWLDNNSNLTGAPGASSVEVMVWLDNSTTITTNPIGTKTGTFAAADGATWEAWSGSSLGGWKVVTYRRTPSSGAVSNLDLLQFINKSTTMGASNGMYLLGVQAGFELYDVTSGGSINNYTLVIN